MSEGTLVDNDLTRLGWRVVHVMSITGPVDANVWLGKLDGQAAERAILWRRYEAAFGAHHLYITWAARELAPVRFAPGGRDVLVVVYWLEKGQRLRDAVDAAACLFLLGRGCWPDAAWVRNLPKTLTQTLTPNPSPDGRGEPIEFSLRDGRVMRLEAAPWALERCVMVGLSDEVMRANKEAVCAKTIGK